MTTKRFVRPNFINIRYIDPFDGTWLATSTFQYEPRRAADGFYTRGIKIMKDGLMKIQAEILEGRTPSVIISFL